MRVPLCGARVQQSSRAHPEQTDVSINVEWEARSVSGYEYGGTPESSGSIKLASSFSFTIAADAELLRSSMSSVSKGCDALVVPSTSPVGATMQAWPPNVPERVDESTCAFAS